MLGGGGGIRWRLLELAPAVGLVEPLYLIVIIQIADHHYQQLNYIFFRECVKIIFQLIR